MASYMEEEVVEMGKKKSDQPKYRKKGVDTRFWDRDYELWLQDPDMYKMPGPHPVQDHPWNLRPELWNFEKNKDIDDIEINR